MSEYRLLTARQIAEIHQRKLLELEAEHARLELDLRLAAASGIENDNVTEARAQLELLAQQIATLISWITPPPAEIPVGANGHREAD